MNTLFDFDLKGIQQTILLQPESKVAGKRLQDDNVFVGEVVELVAVARHNEESDRVTVDEQRCCHRSLRHAPRLGSPHDTTLRLRHDVRPVIRQRCKRLCNTALTTYHERTSGRNVSNIQKDNLAFATPSCLGSVIKNRREIRTITRLRQKVGEMKKVRSLLSPSGQFCILPKWVYQGSPENNEYESRSHV